MSKQTMPIVEYTPHFFERLKRADRQIDLKTGLSHRPFVDYYYTTSDWSKLYLFLNKDENIVGTIGVDRMRFEWNRREMMIGFINNFYSLEPGGGGLLFMKWLMTCPFGVVFGGSEDVHRIIRKQKWTYFRGVRIYLLNRAVFSKPGEPFWRKIAKRILSFVYTNKVHRIVSRIPKRHKEQIAILEQRTFTDDLLPDTSPFTFRFAPRTDYLRWRYNTNLSFVRYRVFRIMKGIKPAGYVILNESPNRLMVSQCDGEDPEILAYAVLLSIVKALGNENIDREILLASSNLQMQKIFARFGFRPATVDRSFAMGSLKHTIELSPDTSNWLINFDWTDNGLRTPFLDQNIHS